MKLFSIYCAGFVFGTVFGFLLSQRQTKKELGEIADNLRVINNDNVILSNNLNDNNIILASVLKDKIIVVNNSISDLKKITEYIEKNTNIINKNENAILINKN
jgi:hypothetical protein